MVHAAKALQVSTEIEHPALGTSGHRLRHTVLGRPLAAIHRDRQRGHGAAGFGVAVIQ